MKPPPVRDYLERLDEFQPEALITFRGYVKECRDVRREGGRDKVIARQRRQIKGFPRQFKDWARRNAEAPIEILLKRETCSPRGEVGRVHTHAMLSRRLSVSELDSLRSWFEKKSPSKINGKAVNGKRTPLKYQVIGEEEYGEKSWIDNLKGVKLYFGKAEKVYRVGEELTPVNVINMVARIGDEEEDVGRFFHHYKINRHCITLPVLGYPFTDSPFFGGSKEGQRVRHSVGSELPLAYGLGTVSQIGVEPILEEEKAESWLGALGSKPSHDSKTEMHPARKTLAGCIGVSSDSYNGMQKVAEKRWITEPEDAWERGEMGEGLNLDGTPYFPHWEGEEPASNAKPIIESSTGRAGTFDGAPIDQGFLSAKSLLDLKNAARFLKTCEVCGTAP